MQRVLGCPSHILFALTITFGRVTIPYVQTRKQKLIKAEHPAHSLGEPGQDQTQGSPTCRPSKWLKDNRTLALPSENDEYPIHPESKSMVTVRTSLALPRPTRQEMFKVTRPVFDAHSPSSQAGSGQGRLCGIHFS